MDNFEENLAKLLFEAHNSKRAFFYVDDAAKCSTLLDRDVLQEMARDKFGSDIFIPQGMPEVYEWVCKNYARVGIPDDDLLPDGTEIYEYTPNRK